MQLACSAREQLVLNHLCEVKWKYLLLVVSLDQARPR